MVVQPGDEFAGFGIDRVLGSGGMGVVYLARHPRLERQVALKVLNNTLATDPRARSTFEREAALAARFDHPNIVTVHDRSGPDNPHLWLSMQYVSGGDAKTLLAASPAGLSAELTVELITDAADALDAAHAAGVLHRDVKPANLLIGSHPRREHRAILTDFGIARALDESATVSTLAATFAYAAPERFLAQPADHRTDVYSLGCTLYQLLTGQPPFPRDTHAAVMAAHLNAPPPSTRELRRDLPAAIDIVIATALAKQPTDRYPSCGALADAARAAIGGSPSAPTPAHVSPGAGPASGAAASTKTADSVRPVPEEQTIAAPAAAAEPSPPPTPTGLHFPSPAGATAQPLYSPGPVTPTFYPPVPGAASPHMPGAAVGPGKRARRRRVGTAIGVVFGVVVLVAAVGIATLHDSGSEAAPGPPPQTPGPPTVVATIPVGTWPEEIVFIPETSTAYVSAYYGNSVAVLDTGTRTLTGTLHVGLKPAPLAAHPGRGKLYVANTGDRTLSAIDLASGGETTIHVGSNPMDVAVEATTHTAYAANQDSTVSVIDTNTDTVRRSVPLNLQEPNGPPRPVLVVVDPTTHRAFATDSSYDTVTVIEPNTDESKAVPVGKSPTETLVDPDTQTVYVASKGADTITAINTRTLAVIRTIETDERPRAMALDPATHTLYFLAGEGTLSKIDTTTNTVTENLHLPSAQHAVALDLATDTAHILGTNGVTVVDTTTYTALPGVLPVGAKDGDVEVDPATGDAYVLNDEGHSVSVISR